MKCLVDAADQDILQLDLVILHALALAVRTHEFQLGLGNGSAGRAGLHQDRRGKISQFGKCDASVLAAFGGVAASSGGRRTPGLEDAHLDRADLDPSSVILIIGLPFYAVNSQVSIGCHIRSFIAVDDMTIIRCLLTSYLACTQEAPQFIPLSRNLLIIRHHGAPRFFDLAHNGHYHSRHHERSLRQKVRSCPFPLTATSTPSA